MRNFRFQISKPFYILIPSVLIVLWLSVIGCARPFYSVNFEEKTADHKTIAVVPIEMIFTGQIPKDWTNSDVVRVEEAESQAFQISFHNEILRSTKSGKKPIRVDLQHYKKTLQLLENNSIGIRDSWKRTPEELARTLGVDAVVTARIQKTRFMSDLESYGIDVATELVNILSDYKLAPWIPVSSQSKEIKGDYAVINGADGTTLWSITFTVPGDWRQPANQIIDNISRRAARNFPYRN